MDRRVWSVGVGILVVALVVAFAPQSAEDQEKPEKDPLQEKILELMKVEKGGLTLRDQLRRHIGQDGENEDFPFDEMFPEDEMKELEDSLAAIYRKHYTGEEIDQLLAFYKTPLGRLLAEKQVHIEEESTPILQKWTMKIALRAMKVIPKRIEERKTGNEVEAIKALRKISSCQMRFRELDMDGDKILDYATSLMELHEAGLIDEEVGAGKKKGYVFGLSGSTYDWLATATPESVKTGTRNFIVCTDGVIRFTSKGSASCSSPAIQ